MILVVALIAFLKFFKVVRVEARPGKGHSKSNNCPCIKIILYKNYTA